VDITGQASDDVVVARVVYRVEDGTDIECLVEGVMSVTWYATDIPLTEGNNEVIVKAYDAAGNESDDSMTIHYLALQQPAGLRTDDLASASFTLVWDPVDNANGYRVYLDEAGYGPDVTDGTELVISGLLPGVTYSLEVSAYNDYGEGPISEALQVTTAQYTISGSIVPSGGIVEVFKDGFKIDETTADEGTYHFTGLAVESEYFLRSYYFLNEFQGYFPYTQSVDFSDYSATVDIALDAVTELTPTDKSGAFWGAATYHADDVLTGDVVTVKDPDNVMCGVYIVQNEGEYGLVTVYGDESGTTEDEGAQEDQRMSFYINEEYARAQGPDDPVWNDTVTRNVDLEAQGDVCSIVMLHKGWNCLTVRVRPVNSDVREVFSDIQDRLIIMREYDTEGVRVYDPAIPFRFCTFTEVAENHGVQIKLDEECLCMIAGEDIAAGGALQLHAGWNVVPYYGNGETDVSTYFSGIMEDVVIIRGYYSDGVRVYDPAIPQRFNTLTILEPPFAYQVKMQSSSETYDLNPEP